jgi:hypothetical protein
LLVAVFQKTFQLVSDVCILLQKRLAVRWMTGIRRLVVLGQCFFESSSDFTADNARL